MGRLSDICEAEGIKIGFVDSNKALFKGETISDFGGAIALRLGNEKYILVDENAGVIEKRLAVAHELAHHIFGHLDKHEVTNSMEEEARLFSVVYAAMSLFLTGDVAQ